MLMDEQDLISHSRDGDLDAFNRLVETYQGQVYSLSYRVLGSAAWADDATQDTFISAFKAIRSYRGGSFRGWLFRIATNTCYDLLRAAKRRPASSLDAMLDDPAWQPSSPDRSPEQQAIQAELGELIASAIQQLPPDQRVALVMVDVEGYSYEETAQATSSSIGTVKSRLSRARAKARDFLLEHREHLPAWPRLQE